MLMHSIACKDAKVEKGDIVNYTYIKVGSRRFKIKTVRRDLKLSSSVSLLKKGEKSFHSFAPVYDTVLKPFVVVRLFGCSSLTWFRKKYFVRFNSNKSLKHFGCK